MAQHFVGDDMSTYVCARSGVDFSHPTTKPTLPGSEDGTIRLWHANTYRLEFTLNYGFERVWCVAQLPGSNTLSIGYDEGTIMIKLGREQPAITMDNSGKIIWAKHSEIQQVLFSHGFLIVIKTKLNVIIFEFLNV